MTSEVADLKERIMQLEIQSWMQAAACERHAMVIQGLEAQRRALIAFLVRLGYDADNLSKSLKEPADA